MALELLLFVGFAFVLGVVLSGLVVGLPLGVGVYLLLCRIWILSERVEGLGLQLGNALLELRTEAVLELVLEDEDGDGEDAQ